jgi:mannose-6-phosphate isomerase
MPKLYPLLFEERLVEKMWGGRSLAQVAGKNLPEGKNIGESWELYDFPPGAVGPDATQPGDDPARWTSAKISNGSLSGQTIHDVLLANPSELLGNARPVSTPDGPQFPLLIKFLDARQDLSVQVHPPPAYAATHANAFVKNECWFVMDHASDARILIGATPGTDRTRFEASLREGKCEELLNAVRVKQGEMYYLPSGTVHALGAGIVAAEVQTPSDTTYRVFDFNRVDPSTGTTRKLHIDQAMDCIDFQSDWKAGYSPASKLNATIVRAPQFEVDRVVLNAKDTHVVVTGEMRVVLVISGSISIDDLLVATGRTVLIPASSNATIRANTGATLLSVRVR